MNLIFCLSYLSIPHTISLIKNKENNKNLIITSNNQIYKFFTELYNNGLVKLIPSFSYTINLPKDFIKLPLKLYEINQMKRDTWNLFRDYTNSNVYFFFNTHAFSQAWLIYKLSENNKIYYQEDIILDTFPVRKGINPYLSKLFIRLIYKEEVKPINQGKNLTSYKMDTEFLDKINAQMININFKLNTIAEYVKEKINLPEGDILLLTNWMPEHEISIYDHIEYSDKLIKKLQKLDYEVHFKMHSRVNIKYSLEKNLFDVPKYLPASFLQSYKVFIGYITSALTEAANNDILAISLINYYPSTLEKKKENMKNYLLNNLQDDKKIHFPSTLKEITELIEKYK